MYKKILLSSILVMILMVSIISTVIADRTSSAGSFRSISNNLPATEKGSKLETEFQLISDELFFYSMDMDSVDQIQTFLESQPGILKNYHEQVIGEDKTAAQIIYEATYMPSEMVYGLNPQVLIVLLEMRSQLISDPMPDQSIIDYAMGYEDSAWKGLYAQLVWTSRELKNNYLDNYVPEGQIISFDEPNAASTAIKIFYNMSTVSSLSPQKTTPFTDLYTQFFGPQLNQSQITVQAAVSPFLYAPYSGDPYITSILDHSISGLGYDKNNLIRPYEGTNANSCFTDGSLRYCKSTVSGQRCVSDPKYGGGVNCYYDGHPGYDYGLVAWTPLMAVADGVVDYVCMSSCGAQGPMYIRLRHDVGGITWKTNYFHMYEIGKLNNIVLKQGDRVTRGFVIGKSGNAGTGAHLHFSVLRNNIVTDPYGWCGSDGDPLPNHGSGNPSTWLWADKAQKCGGPAKPTITSSAGMGQTTIRLGWTASSDPERFIIYSSTNGRTYEIPGNSRWFYLEDLQCNKEYNIELWSRSNNRDSSHESSKAKTGACPGTSAQITNVEITPSILRSGDTLTVKITVKNIGSTVLFTQGPIPGYTYQEGQTAAGQGYPDVNGRFRVGIGCDSSSACNDYPYRWGLGKDLNPGESTTVTGFIKLNSVRTAKYMVGLVEERIKWHQSGQSPTTITVQAATTSCNDSYESNETYNNSRRINIGQEIVAYICNPNDKDWFWVLPTSNGKLIVDVWNIPNGKDYDFNVYSSATGRIGGSARGSNASEHYEFNVQSNKAYDVEIFGYNGSYSTSSSYSMRIQFSSTPLSSLNNQPADQVLLSGGNNFDNYIRNKISTKVSPTPPMPMDAPIVEVYPYPETKTTASLGADFFTFVYDSNITPPVGQGADITCTLRYSPVTNWGDEWASYIEIPMAYSYDSGINDVYSVHFDLPEGKFEYYSGCAINSVYSWTSTPYGHLTVFPAYSVLTYSSDGGTVTPDSGYFSTPTSFNANPSLGYEFEKWFIFRGGEITISYTNPLIVSTDGTQDIQLWALFSQPGAGIYGRVNDIGAVVGNVTVTLQKFNGISYELAATATTNNEGLYDFVGIPTLGPNEFYYIQYTNPNSDPNHLWWWYGNPIREYTSGQKLNGGDFDIQNIPLGGPNALDGLSFPVDFSWTPRSLYPEEVYALEVYGANSGLFWSPMQPEIASYTMQYLPVELRAGQDLGWDVIVSTTQGTGVSLELNSVRFTEGNGNLHGILTFDGQPEVGAHVGLYFYNGSEWQVIDWTQSDTSGDYYFSRLPALLPDQAYAPFYINVNDPNKTDRIWYGDCYANSSGPYDPNVSNFACNIETKDLFLETPFVIPDLFPVTFKWSTRPVIGEETYLLNIFDFFNGQMYQTMSNDDMVTIGNLPYGFSGNEFFWQVESFNDIALSRTISAGMNMVNPPIKVFMPSIIRSGGSTSNLNTYLPQTISTTLVSVPINRNLYPVSRMTNSPLSTSQARNATTILVQQLIEHPIMSNRLFERR